jgi:hypothetical protein
LLPDTETVAQSGHLHTAGFVSPDEDEEEEQNCAILASKTDCNSGIWNDTKGTTLKLLRSSDAGNIDRGSARHCILSTPERMQAGHPCPS